MSRRRTLSPTRGLLILVAALLLPAAATTTSQAATISPAKTTGKADHYVVRHAQRVVAVRLAGYRDNHLSLRALQRRARDGAVRITRTRTSASRRMVLRYAGRAHTSAARPNTWITSGPADGSTTTSRTATFTLASDTGVRFQCSLDRGKWGWCFTPQSYTGLALGSHELRVRAVNRKGAIDATPAVVRWTIGIAPQPPQTTITSGPAAGSSSTSTSASFGFSASVAGATFSCRLDGAASKPCTSPATYSGLAVGTHSFSVAASAGGATDSTPATVTWSVQAPVTPAPTPTPAPDPTPAPATDCARPYSGSSPWNVPISPAATTSPQSAQLTATMMPTATTKLTSDPTQYTFPVYYVTNATPLVTVSPWGWFSNVTNNGTTLLNQRAGTVKVPVPPEAMPANGTDGQVIIINRDTGEEWNAWQFGRNTDGSLTAANVGRYNIAYNAVPPADSLGNPWWLRGAGIPYLAGLIRPCEIAQGHIDHALAFAYPGTTNQFHYPATKADGDTPIGAGMPEGSRLQLDPTLTETQIRAWNCTGPCLTIAKALQTYGMYLIDGSGRPKIMTEYEATAHWNGTITANTASPIPLDKFRLLTP